jgi:Uma2 family endonuclease
MTLAAPSPQNVQRRVVLNDVSWSLYQSLLAEVGDRPIRLTFDQGRLEIMAPSFFHERVKTIIGQLIEAYAEGMAIHVEGCGSTTFDREDLQKGLEPDECYYIANAAAVVGKRELDLSIDPPPDLAIEIDISPPDVARQPIYAALGVPEVWRYDGRRITPLRRTDDGDYAPIAASLSFPDWSIDELNRFLSVGLTQGQPAAVRELREWLNSR